MVDDRQRSISLRKRCRVLLVDHKIAAANVCAASTPTDLNVLQDYLQAYILDDGRSAG